MTLASSARPLVEVHDLVMLDLDGVVYVGANAVPGAAQALTRAREAGAELAYLTNNASREASAVAGHLRELGMPVADDDDVVTSAQAVAAMVATDLGEGAVVLLVGGPGLRGPLEARGLRCVDSLDDDPVAVVQGFHPDLGWADLAEASYAVGSGLPWYASNTDLTVPTARGTAPGNGSLVQAVANATRSRPLVAGKPERALFEETLARTGASAPLMVGDRLDTDVDGAIRAGIPALAVLTGVSTLQDVLEAEPGHRPDLVGHDLACLLEPHPPVELDETRAACGDARVVLDGDLLVLAEGDPSSTAALRCVVALAWRVRDACGTVPRPGGTLEG